MILSQIGKCLVGVAGRAGLGLNAYRNATQYSKPEKKIFDVNDNAELCDKAKSRYPIIVNFLAPWSKKCMDQAARIEAIVKDMDGIITLARVDIEANKYMVQQYDVGTVPMVMVMKRGKEINRIEGLHPADKLREWLEENVKMEA